METVFLDRDGVINENLNDGYVSKWDQFTFIPRSKTAITVLTDAGWDVIVISNQAGVGKGVMTTQAVENINTRMVQEISRGGGNIKAVYYCPHKPDENCGCRKPKPGLLIRAAQEWGITLSSSYLVGDKISDIHAGAQVGCTTILVETGWGKKHLQESEQWLVRPNHVAPDLFEAVDLILRKDFKDILDEE